MLVGTADAPTHDSSLPAMQVWGYLAHHHFLATALPSPAGHEGMWAGTVYLLPSWPVACTNKWS